MVMIHLISDLRPVPLASLSSEVSWTQGCMSTFKEFPSLLLASNRDLMARCPEAIAVALLELETPKAGSIAGKVSTFADLRALRLAASLEQEAPVWTGATAGLRGEPSLPAGLQICGALRGQRRSDKGCI